MYQSSTRERAIIKFRDNRFETLNDHLASEEPLEIQLAYGPVSQRQQMSLAVTMRTPGADFDLVYGFLFTEGLIQSRKDVLQMRYPGVQLSPEAQENSILVELHPSARFDAARLQRHFYTSSSCGICGKASLEMVQSQSAFLLSTHQPIIHPDILLGLPEALLPQQSLFNHTGGIHAAGLFSSRGDLLYLREDVGRHNALDKVIGAVLQKQSLPLSDTILLVSGRAGFELVQKAVMAGIPIMAAVGAPSSLAVELAEAHNLTLVGFLRDGGFNIYTGGERIVLQ
ncbi:MAG: formate dehydrogenase accessory sulfurtransferase FdhD [Haliscomenobacter sp.]|uniref:formate dehydrogenase accessory sulfurtransferase FdhD n=1 Tax=Haliscomenobacter sp. TaxID=2717303 RepID=UPI0029AA1F4B|nr:formate dehydrogenase accessory sulfurtransferase FdhD [Haliscomenobacter sp.]MDX2068089.1 formate dehydrogenase accessory sulfurtransferase FdhD [Haliscomenobacter sp.]